MKKFNPSFPNVIFDWDGFAFGTIILHSQYLNGRYGIPTTVDDFIEHPSLETVVHKYLLTNKKVKESDLPTHDFIYRDLAVNFLESKHWQDQAKPIDGFIEAVQAISPHANIFIVSARHDGSIPLMWENLEKYAIHQYVTDIRCVWKHVQGEEFIGTFKREIIQGIPGTHLGFCDDSPREVAKVCDIVPSHLYDPKRLHRQKEGLSFFESLYQIPSLLKLD
ncbi:MAG: hypothetical protein KBC22_02455 [Candidatus Pacebacteria bacterium]|nr:hypothetical protein [Candidatus Paceibacterota bacterium]